MVYPKIVIKEFCFLEEDTNDNIEIPEIYYKMIKNRIPLISVKHKMSLDNIDQGLIDLIDEKNKNNFIPKLEKKINIQKLILWIYKILN